MFEFIAAIDQGTSSTRCMIFEKSGDIVQKSQCEHRQYYPQPGWVEHDPMEIWQRTQEVVAESINKGNINPKNITAVGITNQRETTLVWDKGTGQPLYPAIVWQDTRTKEICEKFAQEASPGIAGADRFREKTGLPLSAYFSGPKIYWLIHYGPEEIRKGIRSGNTMFGTIDTWLIWWLTGGPDGGSYVTDVTNASRTMLMNLTTLDWDEDILEILEIPKFALPNITSSSDPQTWGMTRKSGPFKTEIPVCGNLGDQQAALFGQACLQKGSIKNTYGTGCFMLVNTGTEVVQSKYGLLTTLGFKIGNAPAVYALEGSIAVTGSLVQWCRDNLGLISSSSDIETLAESVKDNGGVFFVPAFSGLFAPYWRPDARGVIVGLTRYVNKCHLARAVLEATAFQTRDVLDVMIKETGLSIDALKVDGGMVVNNLLMQFQSDILGIPVVRPKITETTALGAAYAAGLAVGTWKNLDEIIGNWQEDQSWEPRMKEEERVELFNNWSKAVERSLNWI